MVPAAPSPSPTETASVGPSQRGTPFARLVLAVGVPSRGVAMTWGGDIVAVEPVVVTVVVTVVVPTAPEPPEHAASTPRATRAGPLSMIAFTRSGEDRAGGPRDRRIVGRWGTPPTSPSAPRGSRTRR